MNEMLQYKERAAAANPAFRVGIVQEQDTARARVRVIFPDYDEIVSWWLPILFPKTQNDKAYWIPDIGEQVVCLMDMRDEDGAVLGAIYSSADTAPADSADKFHLGFKDGASVEYDRAAHVLDLKFLDNAEIKYDAGLARIDGQSAERSDVQSDGERSQVTIDASGNVIVKASGQIQLGTGQLAGVARLGDAVRVQDDEGGMLSGTIVSASIDVLAG